MTFLAKLGHLILAGLQIATGFSSTVLAHLPGLPGVTQVVSKDLTQIAEIVIALEVAIQAGSLTVDQALPIEAAQITQVLLTSALLAGKPLADPTLISGPTGAATDFANGMAKLLKAIHPDAATAMLPTHVNAA